MNWFKKGAILVGVVILLGIGGYFANTYNVSPGHAGLVINWSGGLEDRVLSQGRHTVWFWKKVIEYPISKETVYLSKDGKEGDGTDQSFPTVTNEGKSITVDARYSYHMLPDKLPEIYNKYRGVPVATIEKGWIKTELQKSVRTVTSGYTVFELYGSKVPEINAKVRDDLAKSLEPDGIILDEFSLGTIHADDSTLKSIQANVDAQLALQKLEMEQKQAEITAQTKRVAAQGEADAALIAAQGQAKANKELQQSITPELIQMKAIEKWNGQNSQVVSGGNGGGILVQVQSTDTTKK
jgi:regulator of protease activity HflC (stomatin/prohibitin superfamily)